MGPIQTEDVQTYSIHLQQSDEYDGWDGTWWIFWTESHTHDKMTTTTMMMGED
ncbi:GM13221 [Drosophila sechellia]|uniref:GM13221 n=1 Tax=Drosophila sechellia TaxID=7238 RepID=B4ILB7_DROSE|nr:GM13221 [Drosophila sechellia]